jgi:GTPase SAR1 family protein
MVGCVSFSADGRLLASKSYDGTVLFWRADTWEAVAVLEEPAYPLIRLWHNGLAFHPQALTLATLGDEDTVVRVWDFDPGVLLDAARSLRTLVYYSNARVVLVGDSGVGKSGLGLVLSGLPFAPTDSTHGRRVSKFDSRAVRIDERRVETREILLWDLAGQPAYRLVHQLNLSEASVALVVFDERSETDPFTGVRHWDRALRQAQRAQGDAAVPVKKFLVAARTDRGGVGVSTARVEALARELGFDGYFKTSAKEGWQVAELAEAVRNAVQWDCLPKVSSTALFQDIKTFLLSEVEAGRLLATADDLYRSFLRSANRPPPADDLRAQFENCARLVESQGLIRRLSFGGLVLLRPELLDAYASAIVIAARGEPDGLGSIAEEDVRGCRFRMPARERLLDHPQEVLLLLATVEDLLRHEIALREPAANGPQLVFPSQLTREYPELPEPAGGAVRFTFEGPVANIYATLAVRLSHSGVFDKKELWKNAATYSARVGGTCGLFLRNVEEGKGELMLFFDAGASEETRYQFEEFVHVHLRRRALPDSIRRRRAFVCPECGTPVTELQARNRQQRGHDSIRCGVCDATVSLRDREERLAGAGPYLVPVMDRAADARRDSERAAAALHGKVATDDFDVFLCHAGPDKPAVKRIGEQLKARGILPWLDEWNLVPGQLWQDMLEEVLARIKSAAIFFGPGGRRPWQDHEIRTLFRQFTQARKPLIPVVLPDVQGEPDMPAFLKGFTWVDFRETEPDPLERLIWGITGCRGAVLQVPPA